MCVFKIAAGGNGGVRNERAGTQLALARSDTRHVGTRSNVQCQMKVTTEALWVAFRSRAIGTSDYGI